MPDATQSLTCLAKNFKFPVTVSGLYLSRPNIASRTHFGVCDSLSRDQLDRDPDRGPLIELVSEEHPQKLQVFWTIEGPESRLIVRQVLFSDLDVLEGGHPFPKRYLARRGKYICVAWHRVPSNFDLCPTRRDRDTSIRQRDPRFVVDPRSGAHCSGAKAPRLSNQASKFFRKSMFAGSRSFDSYAA
jgi:hypothetical protein